MTHDRDFLLRSCDFSKFSARSPPYDVWESSDRQLELTVWSGSASSATQPRRLTARQTVLGRHPEKGSSENPQKYVSQCWYEGDWRPGAKYVCEPCANTVAPSAFVGSVPHQIRPMNSGLIWCVLSFVSSLSLLVLGSTPSGLTNLTTINSRT